MQHDSRSSDSKARNLDGGERVKSYEEKTRGEQGESESFLLFFLYSLPVVSPRLFIIIIFFVINFSPAFYNLNAWNRLRI